jgi:hypothetical protein
MPSEGEVPNRNVSSVAITIKSSDSDGESKKTDSDMSNDEVPSDVNKEQSAGLLGKPKTTEDQAIQMGIFPDKEAAPENTGQKNNPNQEFGKKSKSKVLNSAYGSLMLNGAYVSHYNAKGGKFKKTVRQLNSFGIFSKNRTGDENIPKVEISTSNSPAPNVDETFNNNQTSVDTNEKASTAERSEKDVHDDNAKNKTSNDNTKSNVKIFNAPTNWSHVKSRLFDPNGNAQNTLKTSTNMEQKSKDDGSQNTDEKIRNGAKINAPSDYSHVKSRLFDSNGSESQTSLKPSPSPRRKSKVGIEDNDGENISGEADAGKKRNGVKIFNAPSDYSHVKSRLLDPNGSESQTNLKSSPSPSPRRKSKVGIEDNDGENSSGEADAGKKRNGVKIFNSSLDYSHVKSRLFDANANQTNSENLLKPTSNLRRKSKVGIEDDGEESSDELSKSRASVKIFNAPSNYSHVKSKLFDSDKPSNKQSSQVNTQDNDEAKKQENEPGQGKENQLSKSRNNVKILNAPSDYSHVRSRLYDSSNKIKNKVQAINALKSTSERADQNAKNKEASTNL